MNKRNDYLPLSLSLSLEEIFRRSNEFIWNNFELNLSKLENFSLKFSTRINYIHIYLRFEQSNIIYTKSSKQRDVSSSLRSFEICANNGKGKANTVEQGWAILEWEEAVKNTRESNSISGENRGEADSIPRWLSEIITKKIHAWHVDNGWRVEVPYLVVFAKRHDYGQANAGGRILLLDRR